MTRVLIDSYNGRERWSTVGAGTDIICASWLALVDSVEYGLTVAEPVNAAMASTAITD